MSKSSSTVVYISIGVILCLLRMRKERKLHSFTIAYGLSKCNICVVTNFHFGLDFYPVFFSSLVLSFYVQRLHSFGFFYVFLVSIALFCSKIRTDFMCHIHSNELFFFLSNEKSSQRVEHFLQFSHLKMNVIHVKASFHPAFHELFFFLSSMLFRLLCRALILSYLSTSFSSLLYPSPHRC